MDKFESERNKNVRVNGASKIVCPSLQDAQDMVPARLVLYMLSFSGFLVSFMMRTDINIAIIAMVKFKNPQLKVSNVTAQISSCYSSVDANRTSFGSAKQEEGEYNWDATIQAAILGAYYWFYVLSQIVGGLLTQRFGTKRVFGYCQFVTSVCSLLIPTAASKHYGAVIILRSIQGAVSGPCFASMYALIGRWIPLNERSRFMSSFQGYNFGIGLTYPLCGFLIAHYGWRSVFYTTGSLGIVWCIFWWLLAFDTPHKHPRITKKELDYIECAIDNSVVCEKNIRVPWMSILTSLPVWSVAITTFGRIWIAYTFIISGPLYMKTVLGFDIQTNGLLTGLPFLCSYFASVVFCYLADFLTVQNIMSLTNVRKLFTVLSQIVPGLLLVLITCLGCKKVLILITWFVADTVISANSAGATASIVDMVPNLAGPVFGFSQSVQMTASFLSPLVAGLFLKENMGLEQWRKVFHVSGAVAIVTYFSFQLFGTSEVQKWNNPGNMVPSDAPIEDQTEENENDALVFPLKKTRA